MRKGNGYANYELHLYASGSVPIQSKFELNLLGLTAEYPATLKLYPTLGGYVDTRTSHMGTGYQFRVTYFKMLCRICKIRSFREKQATNIIFFVL